MSGLRWRRSTQVDGYESHDGAWVIEHAEAYTECERAHPMRDGTFHDGGEEHSYRYWILWRDGDAGDRYDAGGTLRQMKASAEGALGGVAVTQDAK